MAFIYKFSINIVIPLCLTLLLAQTASAQFDKEGTFIGNTWDDFDEGMGAKAACADDDIDNDNDGLIELCYLEDVNAIRYSLEGVSYKDSMDATGVTTGCRLVEGKETCKGYELVRDLDFNDDDSYSSSTNKVIYTVDDSDDNGWQPIGDSTNSFDSIFEGNGHTISNLTINRSDTDYVGLFGYTGSGSKISNIGLLNVNIDKGNQYTGGLVGQNTGSIANSYATGSVNGTADVGGLVGWNSGGSTIANSYVTGSVKGNNEVGGLVGSNYGSIANSYATGSVNGTDDVGGLVGQNLFGTIANSYVTGSVKGNNGVGGLAGSNYSSNANSYWDAEASGVSTGDGGTSKTTVALQEPTGETGIYSSWSTDNWDFGTSSQYPALKYGGDNSACRTSSDLRPSQQPACRTLLRGQERNYQPRIIVPKNNDEIRISEANMPKTISVKVFDYDTEDKLTLLLSAVDADQNLVVLETTKTQVMTNDKFKRDINEDLSIRALQDISGVATLQLVAVDDSGSGNAMSEPILMQVLVGNIQPTIMPIADIELIEGLSTTLTVVVEDADGDPIDVSLENDNSGVAEVEATDDAGRTLQITALDGGTATITVTANDRTGEANSITTATFTVTVLPNEAPKLVTVPASVTVKAGREATLNVTVYDADIDDVLTLELTAADPTQDFVELVTREVEVATNSTETRAVQTLRIKGLKEGTATLNFVVSDGIAESQPASVEVTVAANAVPKVSAPAEPVTVKAGREATFNVTVSDADIDDVLTLELTTADPDFVKLVTGTVEVETNSAETRAVQTLRIKGLKKGTATLDIVVSDGVAESPPASVEVTVERNSTPTITITPEPLDISLLKGTSATFNVTATDADADDTDIRVQVLSKHITIATAELGAAEGSGYPLTIEAIEAGTAEIEVSANDRRGTANSEATKVFEVVVAANQAPMVVIQNVTTQVVTIGETLSLKTSDFFEDPDGDELSYAVSGFPDGYNFSFSTTTGVLMVTPEIGDASLDKDGLSVTVTATDSNGISAEAMFTLLINAEPSGTVSIRFASWRLTVDTNNVMDANGIAERKYQWFRDNTEVGTTTNTYTIKDNNEERAGGTEYKVDVTFVDNIGQEVTTSSGVYTVVNEAPVIPAIELEEMDEGETVSIDTNASDANHDSLTYTWRVTSRDRDPSILTGVTTNTESISFRVPPDWIDNPSTATGVTETLQLEIAVTEMRDGGETTTQTATVVVTKKNNGNADIPSISVDPNNPNLFTFQQVNIDKDPDGINAGDSNLKYQWQQCSAGADCSPGGNWQDIGSPITDTTNPLSLIPSTSGGVGDKFRVKITYTDGQGYNENLLSGTEEYTTDPAVKIRAKVFLEGLLQ